MSGRPDGRAARLRPWYVDTRVDGLELDLAGVPALVAEPCGSAGRRGTVLVLHGLGGHKGVQWPELAGLARAGFLAVGLDLPGHGARRYPDFDARFPGAGPVAHRSFGEVVEAATREIPYVLDALVAKGWADAGRIGIAGVSMGGFVTYGAVLAERRLGAAVAVIASPEWDWAGVASPHARPDAFFPVALFSVTAGSDELVPPAAARALHAALAPRYATAPARLRHAEVLGAGHMMPEPAWRGTWDEAAGWFTRFLSR